MTKPPILRRLGNKLIATDELVARFDSAGISEDLQSRLEATEQISLKLDTRTEALASELQREQQALRAMVAQFNDQLKANEIHGIQLHERVEQLQEQLLAIRADLGQCRPTPSSTRTWPPCPTGSSKIAWTCFSTTSNMTRRPACARPYGHERTKSP